MEFSIGIDIGGTKIAAALVGRDGTSSEHRLVYTPNSGRDDILTAVRKIVVELSKCCINKYAIPVSGVGVGTAGQVDFDKGSVLSGTTNIMDWNDVPIRSYLAEYTGVPVWVDNDVNVMVLTESVFGVAKGHSNVICLALGTGVGGGVLVDGRMLRGTWGGAAELGHVSVNMFGPECNCGLRGCLETYASGTGIVERLSERWHATIPTHSRAYAEYQRDPTSLTSRSIFRWMRDGDSDACAVVDTMLHALAIAMVGFIHTFNPTIIVLTGGLMEDGEWIKDEVAHRIRRLGIRSMVDAVDIKIASSGTQTGVLGASLQTWVH